jgi:hypothetical protein
MIPLSAKLAEYPRRSFHVTFSRGPATSSTASVRHPPAHLPAANAKRANTPTTQTAQLADRVAAALRESQTDKERFVRTTTMRLQQQLLLRAKLDRTYDDRLACRISDELWSRRLTLVS